VKNKWRVGGILALILGAILVTKKVFASPSGTYELSEGLTPICHVEPEDNEHGFHFLVFERNINTGDVFNVTCAKRSKPLHWDYKVDYSNTEATANISLVSDLVVGENEVFTFKASGLGNAILIMYVCEACPPDFETGEGIVEAMMFSLEIVAI
jgi:hypothetical protein